MMSRISRYHVDWVGKYVSLICGFNQYKYLIGRVSFERPRFHMVVADLRDVSAVVTVGYTYVGDTSYYYSLDIIHAWFIILLMLADEYAMPICSKHIETLQLSSIGGWERNFVSTLLPQF